jgi:1,4-alpha-glucan branching enzyme
VYLNYLSQGITMIKVKVNGPKAWVTFTYTPREQTDQVALSGEWNSWEEEPMKLKKNGEFYLTKVITTGNVYQFGYKIDGNAWIPEETCKSTPSPFFSTNSLLEL